MRRPRATPVSKVAWSPDRKSTRLNSSHMSISYAVFCLKKKKMIYDETLELFTLIIILLNKSACAKTFTTEPQHRHSDRCHYCADVFNKDQCALQALSYI